MDLERPVCVCVTPTTVSTTRKTQHYRHEFVFIPVYTPLVFNLECTLFLGDSELNAS